MFTMYNIVNSKIWGLIGEEGTRWGKAAEAAYKEREMNKISVCISAIIIFVLISSFFVGSFFAKRSVISGLRPSTIAHLDTPQGRLMYTIGEDRLLIDGDRVRFAGSNGNLRKFRVVCAWVEEGSGKHTDEDERVDFFICRDAENHQLNLIIGTDTNYWGSGTRFGSGGEVLKKFSMTKKEMRKILDHID